MNFKKSPIIPPIFAKGINTTIVVRVAAVTAGPNFLIESRAAVFLLAPLSSSWTIPSAMTMALSTKIPSVKIIANRVRVFIVKFSRAMAKSPISNTMGITKATTMAVLKFMKKSKTTRISIRPK